MTSDTPAITIRPMNPAHILNDIEHFLKPHNLDDSLAEVFDYLIQNPGHTALVRDRTDRALAQAWAVRDIQDRECRILQVSREPPLHLVRVMAPLEDRYLRDLEWEVSQLLPPPKPVKRRSDASFPEWEKLAIGEEVTVWASRRQVIYRSIAACKTRNPGSGLDIKVRCTEDQRQDGRFKFICQRMSPDLRFTTLSPAAKRRKIETLQKKNLPVPPHWTTVKTVYKKKSEASLIANMVQEIKRRIKDEPGRYDKFVVEDFHANPEAVALEFLYAEGHLAPKKE